MEKRQMNAIKGGKCPCVCVGEYCGCLYEGPQCPSGDDLWGGSSIAANSDANNPNVGDNIAIGNSV